MNYSIRMRHSLGLKQAGVSFLRTITAPACSLLLGSALIIAACSTDPAADDQAAAASDAVSPAGVELYRVDQQGLQAHIEALGGKAVLLSVWATWCLPCIEAWPQLQRIAAQYADQGLSVVALSVDTPDRSPDVITFLQTHGTLGESFLLDTRNYSEFVYATGRAWEGGVPAYLLYDGEGELRHEFLGANASADLESKIRELLGL